jgi:hypothetical protein
LTKKDVIEQSKDIEIIAQGAFGDRYPQKEEEI